MLFRASLPLPAALCGTVLGRLIQRTYADGEKNTFGTQFQYNGRIRYKGTSTKYFLWQLFDNQTLSTIEGNLTWPFHCTVVKNLGWEFDEKGVFMRLNTSFSQTNAESSEHLMFFMIMTSRTPKDKRKVVESPTGIKFRVNREQVKPRIYHMDEIHTEYTIKNYERLSSYLSDAHKEGRCKNISVVPVAILKAEGGEFEGKTLWVEKFVPNFKKFSTYYDPNKKFYDNDFEVYDRDPVKMKAYKNHVYRVANTDDKDLQDLQDFIYTKSGGKHTIVDIQGNRIKDRIILCDIEFTDTLGKFSLPEKDLMMAYESARSYRHLGVERNFWTILRFW